MSKPKTTRARLEDYLTTIYRLEEAFGSARITDISRELKVSPATVSKIIRKMEDGDLVRRERYRYVKLTSTGKRIAEEIVRKHRIAEVFLLKVLGFNELESHLYAHHLEHLPDIIIERMFTIVSKPALCPHGNSIPGVIGKREIEELMNLNSTRKGQICTIKKIAGEFAEVLEYIYNAGMRVFDPIVIVEHASEGVVVELKDKRRIEVPSYYARFVYVSCKSLNDA
ncbi:MAG: metal-dependent transcriptional regulator [Desulfurococcaceae archaeon]